MMMMHMSFFFGYLDPFLFSSWSLDTPGKIFGAVVFVIILAILYELLKTCRELLLAYDEKRKRRVKMRNVEDVEGQNEGTPLINSNPNSPASLGMVKRILMQYISPLHVVQSLLQVVQVGLGYILMLVAMTFNGYLFLAVCIGAGMGYYLFAGFRRSVLSFGEQSEHCH